MSAGITHGGTMTKAITAAKYAHVAVTHLSDLRTALVKIGRETGGSDPISQAIATYQAARTPEAIRKAVNAGKGRGYDGLITPAVVRRSAADALRYALELEIAQ
jgi:hypothetical protein